MKIKRLIVTRNVKLNVSEYESVNPTYGEEVILEEGDDVDAIRQETVARVNREYKKMVWKELQEVHKRRVNERDEATEAVMTELIEFYQPPPKKKA